MKGRSRPRRQRAGHTDDWLITYADTITLLLCLFVVLLAVEGMKAQAVQDVAQPPVAQTAGRTDFPALFHPFRDIPGIGADTESSDAQASPGASGDDHAVAVVDATAREAITATSVPHQDVAPPSSVWPAPPEAIGANAPRNVATASPDPTDETPPSPALSPPPSAAPRPDTTPATVAAKVATASQISPAPTPRDAKQQSGDRITTLEFSSAAFFATGSATLSDQGKAILHQVANDLKSDKYLDYTITVEGHTDDEPVDTSQFPSNWELSTARAAAVVRLFLNEGVPAQRLRAAGYADTRPVAPNRDAAGNAMPDNQARNRRVVIELEKIERSGPQETTIAD